MGICNSPPLPTQNWFSGGLRKIIDRRELLSVRIVVFLIYLEKRVILTSKMIVFHD